MVVFLVMLPGLWCDLRKYYLDGDTLVLCRYGRKRTSPTFVGVVVRGQVLPVQGM